MNATDKNRPKCKHFKKVLERDGKKVAVKYFPRVCLKENNKIMREWFLTKSPTEMDCFED